MQGGYFKAAWGDIRRSPGWLKKLLRLSLVLLIPVFGWVVAYGYLYGWARDMAWGVHKPLPEHIFGNEDGRLYVRGLHALAITVVFSLVPVVFQLMGLLFTGGSFDRVGVIADLWNDAWSWWLVGPVLGLAMLVTLSALSVLALLFSWVGCMRASVYGRISAGFQLGRIWVMVRRDPRGLARIFGMTMLFSALCGVLASVVIMAVSFATVFMGLVVVDGAILDAHWMHWDVASVAAATLGVLTVSAVVALAASYAGALANAFVLMLVTRALGYWTRGFDVARWQGQDDPMPFEVPTNLL